jgi:hypothetical protein
LILRLQTSHLCEYQRGNRHLTEGGQSLGLSSLGGNRSHKVSRRVYSTSQALDPGALSIMMKSANYRQPLWKHGSAHDAFYRDVLGAEIIPRGSGWADRIGSIQLNVHGPGLHPQLLARIPVQAGNSAICFEWHRSTESLKEHLAENDVQLELGPGTRNGLRGPGTSFYSRDPDGSLLDLIVYSEGCEPTTSPSHPQKAPAPTPSRILLSTQDQTRS